MNLLSSVAGFAGQPASVAGVYDEESGVLVIGKTPKYREQRPEGFSLVTNLDLEESDFKFTDEHLQDAIRYYFQWCNQDTIDIPSELARIRPDNRIEVDGITESGRKYRISGDLDNAQLAVLAMVYYVAKQAGIGAAVEAAREFSILTI